MVVFFMPPGFFKETRTRYRRAGLNLYRPGVPLETSDLWEDWIIPTVAFGPWLGGYVRLRSVERFRWAWRIVRSKNGWARAIAWTGRRHPVLRPLARFLIRTYRTRPGPARQTTAFFMLLLERQLTFFGRVASPGALVYKASQSVLEALGPRVEAYLRQGAVDLANEALARAVEELERWEAIARNLYGEAEAAQEGLPDIPGLPDLPELP